MIPALFIVGPGSSAVAEALADAVALAKLSGREPVNWALGHAALYGRFAEGDLASILAHRSSATPGAPQRASEAHSLQPGTAAWSGFGVTAEHPDTAGLDTAGDLT